MTAQVPEEIIIEGKLNYMACEIPLPEELVRACNEGEAEENDIITFSTACWRNYVGHWEIKKGILYLNNITGAYRLNSETPVKAEWFTGIIRVPQGKMIKYVHMGYESVYEKDMFFHIENGAVVDVEIVDNR